MGKLFELCGHLAAIAGIACFSIAVVGRLLGYYHIVGFEAATLLDAGVAAMLLACLARLYLPVLKDTTSS